MTAFQSEMETIITQLAARIERPYDSVGNSLDPDNYELIETAADFVSIWDGPIGSFESDIHMLVSEVIEDDIGDLASALNLLQCWQGLTFVTTSAYDDGSAGTPLHFLRHGIASALTRLIWDASDLKLRFG
jgi:hypothetical protein